MMHFKKLHHIFQLYYSLLCMLYRLEMNVMTYTNLHFIMVIRHTVVVLHTDSLAVVASTRFHCSALYLALHLSLSVFVLLCCVTFVVGIKMP